MNKITAKNFLMIESCKCTKCILHVLPLAYVISVRLLHTIIIIVIVITHHTNKSRGVLLDVTEVA